ncbi:MAG: AAA family ATPase [Burkholderiales bacterium]
MRINRYRLRSEISLALAQFRRVVPVGPRQVGKTTLARTFVPAGAPNYFGLEDSVVIEQFRSPKTLLENLRGLVVIDEIQHAPELFRTLRVLMDRDDTPAKFLLLGRASPALLRQTGETLLGRVATVEIGGFTLDELGPGTNRGRYPYSPKLLSTRPLRLPYEAPGRSGPGETA